jgi:hypothetical protein
MSTAVDCVRSVVVCITPDAHFSLASKSPMSHLEPSVYRDNGSVTAPLAPRHQVEAINRSGLVALSAAIPRSLSDEWSRHARPSRSRNGLGFTWARSAHN